MPPAGFEPTISAGERPQTYALDRVATGIGTFVIMLSTQIWLWQKLHIFPWSITTILGPKCKWHCCQTELASTFAKNATKPNPFEIIPLQTTRKNNCWKTEEALARAAVTLETERIKGFNPWCLWWWWLLSLSPQTFLQAVLLLLLGNYGVLHWGVRQWNSVTHTHTHTHTHTTQHKTNQFSWKSVSWLKSLNGGHSDTHRYSETYYDFFLKGHFPSYTSKWTNTALHKDFPKLLRNASIQILHHAYPAVKPNTIEFQNLFHNFCRLKSWVFKIYQLRV